jgi:adenylate kinase family enzyme
MYSRICIFGRPGSGKSTFSNRLHHKTALPLYHLDAYFFIANWMERDYQEFLTLQQHIVDQEKWIIDGNCIKSLAMRYARADLCIYFNYPRWLCLLRMIKRLYWQGNITNDIADGCKRNVTWKLVVYMWTFEKRINQRIAKLQATYPQTRYIEIQNRNDLKKVLKLLI